MKKIAFALNVLLVIPGWAAVNVPLTIQETIFPGSVAGVARTLDPVTVGVPLPDSATAGITDVNQLTLAGAAVGQFRVLGRWPSGRIKWVLVDTQASLAAGQVSNSITLQSGGSGNFGGANLATDNGATITVGTGAATFTIKKANFNVVDRVVIGSTTVVASGASQGLVVNGPAPGQTTCPPCTTVYSSANDANSTAVIEENGPAKVVIKATGNHVDGGGHVYMRFTVRMYFYLGKSSVKVTSVLRNADYGVSNSFATAYKGHQGYELRIQPNMASSANYSIGNETSSPTTGALTGSDSVYLYQAESQQMKSTMWCGYLCVPFTNDTGFSIVKNGSPVRSGADTLFPQGWADVSDSNGVGVSIGVYELAAYWPKSLEFNNGGRDVRIGIWPRQNSQPYYQTWPQSSTHDLFLNFHATAPASPANDFLKFQHYLVGRTPLAHYNATGVFPYTLIDPAVEDAFYTSLSTAANPATLDPSRTCCIQDQGTANTYLWPLYIYRFYAWHTGGGDNQSEFRWSYLMNFLSRGMTGRYLHASHFYRFQADSAWPHADGFNWRDRPHYNQANPEVDGFGHPSATSLNSSLAISNAQGWFDQEHGHWYGMTDYYFLTGDETARDSLLMLKDYFLNTDTYQNGSFGGLWNARAVGVQLMGAARFSQFLQDTGDISAPAVLTQGTNDFNAQVKPELCVSGYPSGCNNGPVDGGPWTTAGVSRTRGVFYTLNSNSQSWCGVPHALRIQSAFQSSILIQGLLELNRAAGPAWSDYYTSLDLAYGMSRWILSELYADDGTGKWDVNGFRYYLALDWANNCTGAGETPEPDVQVQAQQTVSMAFLPKYLVDHDTSWATKFKINLQKDASALGMSTGDFGSYQPAHMINIINNPPAATLNVVPVSGFVDNGGGSYTISWIVPAGAQSYRIKWGAKQIVDWIGFDPMNNAFTGNPATTMPWFAAANASGIPAPAAAGTTQSFTISTGTTGLKAANFSVKAYATGTSGPPSVPTTLSGVSGSGQAGVAGQPLSSPFVVKVADASGSGVAGVAVTFSVTGGGGSLSAALVSTDALGLAATTLTLGATPGANTVTATSGSLTGSPVTFTATGALSPAATLSVSGGNGQTGPVGKPLGTPLTVKVSDLNGNGVSGFNVAFSIASGGGTLSAALATTNTQGLASTSLTLGPTPGTNTVTVTAASLSGSPLTFTATGIVASAADVSWTVQPHTAYWPGYNGYLTIVFDPISQQTVLYGIQSNSSSIYSTDLMFYNAATNLWTHVSGTGSTVDACPADTPSQPGNRHPVGNLVIDTKRNVLWMWGGVCMGVTPPDMYYLTLNADPKTDTWHLATPAHLPPSIEAASAYDSDDDVIFTYGYDGSSATANNWVYCPTTGNPTPGVLTAKQTAAGCAKPDDWTNIIPVGGIGPRAQAFPGMVYDTLTHKMILYGGLAASLATGFNETWAYDVPSRTWTKKDAGATAPPPISNFSGDGLTEIAYHPTAHMVFYHQTFSAGAPADWQYNPATDIWSKLVSVSGRAGGAGQVITYDSSKNALIGFNLNSQSGAADVWQGDLSGWSAGQTNACDLNGDHTVNVLDVQLAIRQALGVDTCKTGDINGDGVCNAIDVQRVIAASLGLGCNTAP